MMKRTMTALATIGMLGGFAAGANASIFFDGELNQLSDNNAEYLQNADGTGSDMDSIVDEGDLLRAIFRIDTAEDLTGGGGEITFGSDTSFEITGFSSIMVINKIDNGDGTFDFIFGPDPAFASEVEALSGGAVTAGDIGGAMIAFFQDPSMDFDRGPGGCATVAACTATATGGDLKAVLGFEGDADELWAAFGLGTDDIGVVGNTPPPTAAGSANVQVSFLFNEFFGDYNQVSAGIALDDGLIDMNGTIDLLGVAGANTPFDAFSDLNAAIRPIPAPATVGLLGLGLLGMGIAIRRRRHS